MTITLPAVAASTTPTVIKTFFKHYTTQMKKDKEDRRTEATDEFMFHQAFAIVKHFISLATSDTVEALQRFTNTHVPATPGATSLRLLIPMTSCNQAASLLIEYFGEKDLKELVGGSRWWQVRGLNGVQGEWIAMTKDWKRAQRVEEVEEADGNDEKLKRRARELRLNQRHERKRSQPSILRRASSHKKEAGKEKGTTTPGESNEPPVLDEGKDEPSESFEELDRLKRVMYYIHGGGYYFGSINTHRLMITRFARKFGGRAFAVSYRKAPQYPWPCPVQDVLAGYLYLIDPPPEARHKAIDPAHIVIAGDSAGGGLALALLGVLRDLDKPMPAGAVLLSPWCDLTHSFPSILQNTETDIIPRYSFIHKPSTLWPIPGVRPERKQGTATKEANCTKEGTSNDAKNPPKTEESGGISRHGNKEPEMAVPHGVGDDIKSGKTSHRHKKKQDVEHLAVRTSKEEERGSTTAPTPKRHEKRDNLIPEPLDHLYSEPLTIPMQGKNGKDMKIELRQQIQLYATNAQLYHPLCSPILQGSLGGLPPLYILAGDSEVLRDEIIHLAHRAARPQQYALNDQLMKANERCRMDAERFNSKPTKVHLQVYDGQPHVLTLFSFTTSAMYAYRAIASFVKHVTGAPTNLINPFPHLENASSMLSEVPSNPKLHTTTVSNASPTTANADGEENDQQQSSSSTDSANSTYLVDAPIHGESLRQKRRRDVHLGSLNAYDGQVPLRRPTYVQEMIRERVDIRGQLRPLEDEHLLQALQVDASEIGKIKGGPVQRYLTGQELWDKKFKRTARRVEKKRAKNEARAQAMLEQAASEGLLGHQPILHAVTREEEKEADVAVVDAIGGRQDLGEKWSDAGWADLAVFGPLDLEGEVPPPSAIAGRRDTTEALELLRQSLHMRAHRLRGEADATAVGAKVSFGSSRAGLRSKTRVKLREHAGGGWRQSAAERQVESKASYGLRAWGGAMMYMTRKSKIKTQATATSTEAGKGEELNASPAEWEDDSADSTTERRRQPQA